MNKQAEIAATRAPDEYELVQAPSTDSCMDAPPPAVIDYLPVANVTRACHRFDILESSPFRHLYAPLTLVLLGIAAVFIEIQWSGDFGTAGGDPYRAIRTTVYLLLWNSAVMLFGAYIAATFAGIGFGNFTTASLRLAAVAFAALGVASVINFFTNSVEGTFIGWMASIVVYWALFWWLFELDPQEAFIAVGVTTVARWASYLLYWIVLHRYLPSPF